MKELPEKYYLSHFVEFVTFIKTTSAHLLATAELDFISHFETLNEDAQCMLVRIVNRKSPFIRKDTLTYNEINDSATAINILRKAGFVARISKHTLSDFFSQLNKQDLIDLSKCVRCEFASSRLESFIFRIHYNDIVDYLQYIISQID